MVLSSVLISHVYLVFTLKFTRAASVSVVSMSVVFLCVYFFNMDDTRQAKPKKTTTNKTEKTSKLKQKKQQKNKRTKTKTNAK